MRKNLTTNFKSGFFFSCVHFYLFVLLTLLCKCSISHPPTDRPSDRDIYVRTRRAGRVSSATPPSRIDLSNHVTEWPWWAERIQSSSVAAKGWRRDFWEPHQADQNQIIVQLSVTCMRVCFYVCVWIFCTMCLGVLRTNLLFSLFFFLFLVQQRLILKLHPLLPLCLAFKVAKSFWLAHPRISSGF